MTIKTAFFLTTLLGLTVTACDSDGDTGTDGATSGASSTGAGGETEAITTMTESGSMTGSATGGATTTTGSASTGGETSTTASTTQGETGGSESGSSGGDTGSETVGSTGSATAQELCESTGGTWDDVACGDYVCGQPNLCEAIIPGCDCGPMMNFREDEGCQEDPACEAKPATFACGDELACSVDVEYCEVFFPGVMGASISYTCRDMPDACQNDANCECLNAQLGLGFAANCTEDILTGGDTVQIFGA